MEYINKHNKNAMIYTAKIIQKKYLNKNTKNLTN